MYEFKTGSIREVHSHLVAEGYRVSEHSIRQWVKQDLIPAAYVGRKAYINYDAVLAVLTHGTPQPEAATPSVINGIRKVG